MLKDIDTSWNISKKESSFKVLANGDNFRVYYAIRNRVFFEKENLINSKFFYWLNVKVYMLILKFFAKKKKMKLLNQAIQDGLNNRLGRTL